MTQRAKPRWMLIPLPRKLVLGISGGAAGMKVCPSYFVGLGKADATMRHQDWLRGVS